MLLLENDKYAVIVPSRHALQDEGAAVHIIVMPRRCGAFPNVALRAHLLPEDRIVFDIPYQIGYLTNRVVCTNNMQAFVRYQHASHRYAKGVEGGQNAFDTVSNAVNSTLRSGRCCNIENTDFFFCLSSKGVINSTSTREATLFVDR